MLPCSPLLRVGIMAMETVLSVDLDVEARTCRTTSNSNVKDSGNMPRHVQSPSFFVLQLPAQ